MNVRTNYVVTFLILNLFKNINKTYVNILRRITFPFYVIHMRLDPLTLISFLLDRLNIFVLIISNLHADSNLILFSLYLN